MDMQAGIACAAMHQKASVFDMPSFYNFNAARARKRAFSLLARVKSQF